MRRVLRAALLGVAGLVGALGLSGVQQRIVTSAAMLEIAAAKANAPQGPQVPAQSIQAARTYSRAMLPTGAVRRAYPAEGIWVGYMRAGAATARPCWKVGRRGGRRVGRR